MIDDEGEIAVAELNCCGLSKVTLALTANASLIRICKIIAIKLTSYRLWSLTRLTSFAVLVDSLSANHSFRGSDDDLHYHCESQKHFQSTNINTSLFLCLLSVFAPQDC